MSQHILVPTKYYEASKVLKGEGMGCLLVLRGIKYFHMYMSKLNIEPDTVLAKK